jgi:hypothetical protein
MSAFSTSMNSNLKKLSQHSIQKGTDALDRSATSTQQQNITKDANTSVEPQKKMDNGSPENDRNSNDVGYQGKKKTIEHKCVLQIQYRDEIFSPNGDYLGNRDLDK